MEFRTREKIIFSKYTIQKKYNLSYTSTATFPIVSYKMKEKGRGYFAAAEKAGVLALPSHEPGKNFI